MIEILLNALQQENVNVFRLVLMRRDGSFETADRLPTTPCQNCYSISKAVPPLFQSAKPRIRPESSRDMPFMTFNLPFMTLTCQSTDDIL